MRYLPEFVAVMKHVRRARYFRSLHAPRYSELHDKRASKGRATFSHTHSMSHISAACMRSNYYNFTGLYYRLDNDSPRFRAAFLSANERASAFAATRARHGGDYFLGIRKRATASFKL